MRHPGDTLRLFRTGPREGRGAWGTVPGHGVPALLRAARSVPGSGRGSDRLPSSSGTAPPDDHSYSETRCKRLPIKES